MFKCCKRKEVSIQLPSIVSISQLMSYSCDASDKDIDIMRLAPSTSTFQHS